MQISPPTTEQTKVNGSQHEDRDDGLKENQEPDYHSHQMQINWWNKRTKKFKTYAIPPKSR